MDRNATIPITRRKALGLLAVTAGSGFLSAKALAQGSPLARLELVAQGAGVCTLTPRTMEGPYYFDPELERSDITEGWPGVPLELKLQIIDTACQPLAGARVDIWHCDATGHYSGYPGQGDRGDVDTSGEKFLRGWLRADAEGMVTFATIYPGWYRGRTTHIHFKVFPDEGRVATGQVFFPDDVSEAIFAGVAPYNQRSRTRDTMNGDDGILRRAGEGVMAKVGEVAGAHAAAMVIAIEAG